MILMYHKVHPLAKTFWWVSVDAFDRQMAALRDRQVVFLDDYDAADPSHVAITFDGIYENVLEYALPILRKWGYPFELFVIGDWIGRDNEFDQGVEPPARFASVEQLERLVEGGGRVQWHTRTHEQFVGDERSAAAHELTVPEELRARFSDEHFRWFAYPHAQHADAVRSVVGERFVGAVGGPEDPVDDRLRLGREVAHEASDLGGSRVSIVIANYNYGRYLPEAIDSVLRQTQAPHEILVMDDASTDESSQMLSWYADDERIRVHVNEQNLGIVGNFARGVSLTSGDYVAFLGADNRMRSDYVERLRAALDAHPEASMAYPDMSLFGPLAPLLAAETGAEPTPADDVFIWRTDDPTPERMAKLEYENWMSGSSMYRRSDYDRAGGYRDSDRPEDHDLFVRLLGDGRSAVHVREPLIEYRQHSAEQANTAIRYQLEAAHERSQAAFYKGELETTARVLEETRAWLAHQERSLGAAVEAERTRANEAEASAEVQRTRAERAEAALHAIRSGNWWQLHERLEPVLKRIRPLK